jgi:MFS family permease
MTLSTRQINGIALTSTFITSILTFATRFAYGYGIFVAFSVLGFAAGIIVPLLQRFIINQIPQNSRGKALGSSIGIALFVNFVLFILLVPAGGSTAIYTKAYADSQACLASVIFLMTGLSAIGFCGNKAQPVQAIPDYSIPDTVQETRVVIMPRFIVMLFVVCLCFYSNVGIQDHVITLSWFAGGNAMFFTRIFSFIGALLEEYLKKQVQKTGLTCFLSL